MLPWIIAAFVATAGVGGFVCGTVVTALFGAATALKVARMHPDWPEPNQEDDEVCLHDALTIRDLLRAAQPVIENDDAAKCLALGEYTAFADAVMAAEDRFGGWIEWAESDTATPDEVTA